jgi:hypothetical protein
MAREDDRATSGRNHADTSCNQARVHARLVRGPPTRLVYAVVLLGHSRHVLLDIYIARSVFSSIAELHLGRTELVPSHLRHALAQHDQSDHLVQLASARCRRVPRGKEAKLHAGRFVVDSDALRP